MVLMHARHSDDTFCSAADRQHLRTRLSLELYTCRASMQAQRGQSITPWHGTYLTYGKGATVDPVRVVDGERAAAA